MITIPQERTATPAEPCDEISRTEQTAPGPQLPRTLHAIIEQAARPVRCPYCGRKPGRACTDAGGVDGFHLNRFVRAAGQGLMAADEFAVVLGGLDVFTNATVIRDGGR